MPWMSAVQIIIILAVLVIAGIDLYLSHIRKPKSDIIFNAKTSSRSGAKHIDAEFDYWCRFTANNRGNDNAWVTNADLLRLEFHNSDNPNETDVLEGEALEDCVYGQPPLVILQREREGKERNERGSLMVEQGKPSEILVVLRIFSGEIILMVKRYDRTVAVIEFEVVDSEQSYTKVVESEPLRTDRLLPDWVDEEEGEVLRETK